MDDTGEKPRTIQHWSDLGILRAESGTDKQGRGTHREYRADPLYGERTWALLASTYAKLRLPLADIRRLIYADRLFYDPVDLIDKNDPHYDRVLQLRAELAEERKRNPNFVPPFEAALAGEPNILAVVALRPHDPVKPIVVSYLRHVARAQSAAYVDEFPRADDWQEDDDIENYQSLPDAQQKDLMKVLSARRTQERSLRSLMTDNPMAMVVNLSKIFEPLRRTLPPTGQ